MKTILKLLKLRHLKKIEAIDVGRDPFMMKEEILKDILKDDIEISMMIPQEDYLP